MVASVLCRPRWICPGTNADEQCVRARVGPELVEEGFRYARRGDDCPGGHGRMDAEHRADGGEGGGPHDLHPPRREPVTLDHQGVAEFLVELRQGGGPEHDLSGPVHRMTREDRGSDRGPRRLDQERHDVASDLRGPEVGTGRRLHVAVTGQARPHDRRRDRAVPVGRVVGVVEVPPVENGMRDQRIEAGPEGEGGGDHRDGQDCPHNDRAHRGRAASAPALQGEAKPSNARHGETRGDGQLDDAR